MNIILFDADEIGVLMPRSDARVRHILEVLRRQIGDATDVGLVNGPRGKAILASVNDRGVEFDFRWNEEPEPLLPITLIVGLCRPQTCRKILQEATSLGVGRILFATTQRGEPSYAQSKLWTTGQWKRCVRAGVEQAFSTWLPEVNFGMSLNAAIASTATTDRRICLDNYEATASLSKAANQAPSAVIAIGSERGWTGRERTIFTDHDFTFAHLGERPLRTETATIAAISIVSAALSNQLGK